jgi:DNA-binding NarL/FixJ family response regulator
VIRRVVLATCDTRHRRYLRDLLARPTSERWAIQVESVIDPGEAVEAAKAIDAHAVIIDVSGEPDPAAAVRDLRAASVLEPVVAVTAGAARGKSDAELVVALYRAGASYVALLAADDGEPTLTSMTVLGLIENHLAAERKAVSDAASPAGRLVLRQLERVERLALLGAT